MPIGSNMVKQDLSFAYALAISAKAGFVYELSRNDHDGVDASIKGDIVLDEEVIGSSIDIQMKSTSSENCIRDLGDTYSYQLRKKNYDDLRAKVTTPRFLALLILPENEHEWLEQDIDKLIIRHCMYWVSLKGMEPVQNPEYVSVHIPKANVFNIEQLNCLLIDAARGVFG